MSVVITSSDQICKDPTNTSPSKAQYSFSKEQRFNTFYRPNNPNPNSFYFEGQQFQKISSLKVNNGKFGKTQRPNQVFISQIRHLLKTPDPQKYKMNSTFDVEKVYNPIAQKSLKKSFENFNNNSLSKKSLEVSNPVNPRQNSLNVIDKVTFGIPRDATNSQVSPDKFNFLRKKATDPGPFEYTGGNNPYVEISSSNKKQHVYSLRPKNLKSLFQINENPGPGQYYIPEKKIPVAVIKQDINPNATVLSRIPLKKVPGPQCYGVDNEFMSKQNCFVEAYKKVHRGNKFSEQKRNVFDMSKNKIPGPGQYRVSSAFGHYIDKKQIYKTLEGSFNQSKQLSKNSNLQKSNENLVRNRLVLNPVGLMSSSQLTFNINQSSQSRL